MAETALAALYRAVYERLVGAGSEAWGERVFPDLAPAGTERPLVLFSYAAGGEANRIVGRDAELVLTVQAVCTTDVAAFACAARIAALLNDADRSRANAMDGGADWVVLNATQEQALHRVDTQREGDWLYYEGARFRFVMEGI